MSTNLRIRFLIPLLLIPLILVVIWFRNGLIMGGGEEGLTFYNPSNTLKIAETVWMEYGTGNPSIGGLSTMTTLFYPVSFLNDKLHVSNFILQSVTFLILLLVGTIAVYFLALNLIGQHQFRYKIALVSAIFYLLNPFTISQIWGRSITAQFFAFALLPTAIIIFLIGLQKRQYIFTIFLTFVSVVFSTAFGFITFAVTYWAALTLIFIFWVITSKQKKKDFLFGLSFFVPSLFLWIIAHSWWLISYIPLNYDVTSERLGDPQGNLNSLIGVSRNFTPDLVVRLLQRSYFSEVGYYGKIYVSILFQLISLIPFLFVILGFIKAVKLKELKQFRFFIILFVLGLFVSLGANPPLGWLFVWIFKNIAVLQAFRNPYEKFGLVYVLGYAALFALGTVYFFQRRFKKFGLLIVLILSCGIFVWPIWTGRIFAGPDKKVGRPVPSYYRDLREFLNQNSQGYRVFMTPVWAGDGSSYLWKDSIYQGIDPTLYLLDQPTISNTLHGPYYYDFISNIRRYMDRINLAPSLALLRTKYLVDRGDANMVTDSERLHYELLTTAIHPPNDVNTINRSICQDINVSSQETYPVTLICPIPKSDQDWRGVRYLHLEVKASVPVSLSVTIKDKKEAVNRWDGRVVSEYQTDKDDWESIIIPLNVPTEYSSSNQIDFSSINLLEILVFPKDTRRTNSGNITLKGIRLDPGRTVDINEFNLINTLGKLKVYEPTHFKAPPEFGSFSKINKVLDFVQLFQTVNQKRDTIDQEGFLLPSQNPHKDLTSLSSGKGLGIVNKSKLSGTRYWVETDQNSEEGFLMLSKTFNPQWKVISQINKNDLDGSFGNDIKLLKKTFLPESSHYVVNGYANLWKIDSKKSPYAIVYIPQIIADLGLKVSLFSVLMMVGFTIIWGISKVVLRHNRK